MPRFFVTPSQVQNGAIVIQGNDVNHIKNVLRMRPGDELSVSDGSGMDYFCTIRSFNRDEVCLSIENSWKSYVELPVKLYLFQGLPKGDKMELIIQLWNWEFMKLFLCVQNGLLLNLMKRKRQRRLPAGSRLQKAEQNSRDGE